MNSVVLRHRRILAVTLHAGLIAASSFAALLLRFDGAIPQNYLRLFWQAVPWLIAVRMVTFAPFRLYEGLWRYSGIWDLRNIIIGVVASSGVFYQITLWLGWELSYPRSILVIDSLLLILGMGGARLGRRLAHELSRGERSRRVLIFGAGDAGERIVRGMHGTPSSEYEPIGFVDDNPAKVGLSIHGVEVLGTRKDVPALLDEHKPGEILVAMPSASPAVVGEIVRALQPYRIPIKTLPKVREISSSRGLVSQIRDFRIEDLLERAPIGLDSQALEELIKDKRVLVTGAGGSIGSELCYQIAGLKPASLTVFDRYENGLFAVINGLASRNGHCAVHSLIGDVTDHKRLEALMEAHRPQIVFHAAAHKHVPLMEANPCEAVKNNVFGTRLLMDASARHGVECFVLISTDKAVNPTSVMGATKRVAEMLVQTTKTRGRTRFVSVRFGNVLASNGSVVPTFVEQIKAGGPVTVTHPDIRRYFMLIPEAVQLVLQAAALAEAGAVYVLEMGEQMKLVDMARTLIRLSGLVPDVDIPIVFTGLRPGEKLYEELVGAEERVEAAGVEKIMRVRPTAAHFELGQLIAHVARLERAAFNGNTGETLRQLSYIVPTFTSGLSGPSSPTSEDADRMALVS